MDRYAAQSTWTALHLAVCHIVGLDKRLETMLWHLAERWGRVGTDGVILPLRFSHEFLARLVGVRRPSVTTAVTRLRQEGLVERRPDGSWLLHGSPPAEPAAVRRPHRRAPPARARPGMRLAALVRRAIGRDHGSTAWQV